MNLSDNQLRVYIDEIFDRYDADRSGNLDAQELANFFNDLFRTIGNPTVITQAQAQNAICSIDKNNDGKANKMELFMAFKGIISGQPQQQQYPQMGYQQGQMMQQSYTGQQNPYQQYPQQGFQQSGHYGNAQYYGQPIQQPYPQQAGYGYQNGYQPAYNNPYGQQQPNYGQPMYGSGGRW